MRATGQIETNRETGGGEALSSAAVVLHAKRALGIFPKELDQSGMSLHSYCRERQELLD